MITPRRDLYEYAGVVSAIRELAKSHIPASYGKVEEFLKLAADAVELLPTANQIGSPTPNDIHVRIVGGPHDGECATVPRNSIPAKIRLKCSARNFGLPLDYEPPSATYYFVPDEEGFDPHHLYVHATVYDALKGRLPKCPSSS